MGDAVRGDFKLLSKERSIARRGTSPEPVDTRAAHHMVESFTKQKQEYYLGLDIWQPIVANSTFPIEIENLEGDTNDRVDSWLRKETRPSYSVGRQGNLRVALYYNIAEPSNGLLLPYNNRDFEHVASWLNIPSSFAEISSNREPCFQLDTECSDERFGLFYAERMQGLRRAYNLGISYNPKRNTTTGLFRCMTRQMEPNTIIEKALTRLDLVHNPFWLPLLILKQSVTHLNRVCGDMFADFRRIMLAIGQHPFEMRTSEFAALSPLDLDFVKFTTDLNRFSGAFQILERRYQSQLVIIREIQNSIPDLQAVVEPQFSSKVKASCRVISIELRNLKCKVDLSHTQVVELEKNCRTQLAVLYNFMAQKDNRVNLSVATETSKIAAASKRDSSAMKTIAVLTIVFLPGTYMAALFAMPIFNWQAPSRSAIVSRRIWVYWAFTIPLTALVILTWCAWMWWRISEQKKEDSDIEKQADFAGMVKRVSSSCTPSTSSSSAAAATVNEREDRKSKSVTWRTPREFMDRSLPKKSSPLPTDMPATVGNPVPLQNVTSSISSTATASQSKNQTSGRPTTPSTFDRSIPTSCRHAIANCDSEVPANEQKAGSGFWNRSSSGNQYFEKVSELGPHGMSLGLDHGIYRMRQISPGGSSADNTGAWQTSPRGSSAADVRAAFNSYALHSLS